MQQATLAMLDAFKMGDASADEVDYLISIALLDGGQSDLTPAGYRALANLRRLAPLPPPGE